VQVTTVTIMVLKGHSFIIHSEKLKFHSICSDSSTHNVMASHIPGKF